ncbi:hypothetical protein [Jannaschia faecimaris]|uniref:hypothetical protein n=1 Tax=Jannaschia faecimaris TaxID=1244108 RepID=UPI0011133B50|nr:hypothetical protein [Jannaschia faecimaris]
MKFDRKGRSLERPFYFSISAVFYLVKFMMRILCLKNVKVSRRRFLISRKTSYFRKIGCLAKWELWFAAHERHHCTTLIVDDPNRKRIGSIGHQVKITRAAASVARCGSG